MAENPLVRLPSALPALNRANALRRRVEGRLRSFDLLSWPEVAYGEDAAQKVSLWELDDLAPRDGWPAVLLLHGGGWVEGSWTAFESLGPAFAHRGVVAAAINYRLAPEHRWPAQLEDVRLALDFLQSQQIDPERIALWGHSAGGHLALMAAARWPEQIRAVVALGAPTDLARLDAEGPDDLHPVFDRRDLAEASPLHALRGAMPPTLLVHGSADRVVQVGQARALAAARPDRVTLLEVPDGDHGLRWPPLAALRARRAAMRWLGEAMNPAPRGSKWKIRKKKNR